MPSAPAWRRWPPTTASTPCSPWPCPRPSPTCAPRSAAAAVSKPIAAALLDQAESVRLLGACRSPGGPAAPGRTARPAQARRSGRTAGRRRAARLRLPGSAARALGHAARYRAWRDRQHGHVPELSGLRAADARALIAGFLAGYPAGGWLPAASGSRAAVLLPDPAGRHAARRPRAGSGRGPRRSSAGGSCSRPRPRAGAQERRRRGQARSAHPAGSGRGLPRRWRPTSGRA